MVEDVQTLGQRWGARFDRNRATAVFWDKILIENCLKSTNLIILSYYRIIIQSQPQMVEVILGAKSQ